MATENTIPPEIARALRHLTHDLSNALETIVQACYLLNQTDLPQSSRRWLEMMEQASQDAVSVNRQLREILRQR